MYKFVHISVHWFIPSFTLCIWSVLCFNSICSLYFRGYAHAILMWELYKILHHKPFTGIIRQPFQLSVALPLISARGWSVWSFFTVATLLAMLQKQDSSASNWNTNPFLQHGVHVSNLHVVICMMIRLLAEKVKIYIYIDILKWL